METIEELYEIWKNLFEARYGYTPRMTYSTTREDYIRYIGEML